jgi:uncharacterized protein (TIGR02391 family)
LSNKLAPWPEEVVRGVADVLGHTGDGLSGSQIAELLASVGVPDIAPASSKRERLFAALATQQHKQQASNCIVGFITKAMTPVRYRDKPGSFNQRQDALGEVLVYIGLKVNDEGKVATGPSAATLSEAAKRANSLRAELRRRGTHPEVLRWCLDEVLVKDAFHASLEAAKGLAQRLRDLTGEKGDGAKVVDSTLALGSSGNPMLAINSLGTKSEEDEQTGFANLLRGIFGMYRNPMSHDPRALRPVSDEELLELFTMISTAHRRLDNAVLLKP